MQSLNKFLLLLLTCTLVACGAASEDELNQWMTEQKNQTHPRIKPISEPKKFKPEAYAQAAEVEPFSNQKLTQALKKDSTQSATNASLIAPELARRKEPLEEFPLDSMTLVGSMVKAGQQVGLVKVSTLLYQVRLGEHIGQNYGKVTKITETEITLLEIVQDAVGEWTQRSASLQLQQRSK
jgi:type IV pilus assembly protein PilP